MDFRNLRGVDLDGVGLGVGVISGGVAFGAFVSCCLNERTKIPVGGSAGDCIRGHAGRQRVADRAAGKTGGDIFGDRVESVLQPVEVTSRVGLAGGNIGVQIVEKTDICICVRILHFLVGSTKADGVERIIHVENFLCLALGRLEGFRVAVLAITIGIRILSVFIRNTMVARSVIIGRFAVSQRNDVLRSCVGDNVVAKQVLCLVKALLQIGAAVGTQVVDGILNSVITRVGGNVLPFTLYFCAVGKGNQCGKASRSLTITIKEIDGRSLGGIYAAVTRRRVGVLFLPTQCSISTKEVVGVLFLLTGHRAGGVDDEHRCGLRVAGLSRGGRVHLHLQSDHVLVAVAGRLSGLADGINAVRQLLLRCAFSPATAFVIVANLHVTWRCLIRQHVERQ